MPAATMAERIGSPVSPERTSSIRKLTRILRPTKMRRAATQPASFSIPSANVERHTPRHPLRFIRSRRRAIPGQSSCLKPTILYFPRRRALSPPQRPKGTEMNFYSAVPTSILFIILFRTWTVSERCLFPLPIQALNPSDLFLPTTHGLFTKLVGSGHSESSSLTNLADLSTMILRVQVYPRQRSGVSVRSCSPSLHRSGSAQMSEQRRYWVGCHLLL
ncbi:hypothetical protein B0H14DRAFT_34719 [Mycena olivaceomarginata]|nr:hypothetical protein B0H14DRAFT_34719 [Mycena olivaceomarginata]